MLFLGALFVSVSAGCGGGPSDSPETGWMAAPGLKTPWASEVNPEAPHPEYPRPQMVREDWINLNGLWDLAVLPAESPEPGTYPDRILVPFPVESALSGVARRVGPEERVWYRRTFSLPDASPATASESQSTGEEAGLRWLLHFGAVDWEAEVFLNGASMGTHRGGYDPFTLDVTDHLTVGAEQELVVAVWDPTDEGDQPRGKQVLDPHGIWYTAVTGIWQTVWLEPVPEVHVRALAITPRPESGAVDVEVEVSGSQEPVPLRIAVLAGSQDVAQESGISGQPISLSLPEPRLWSPDDPFLYDLRVEVGEEDAVESYFGMRSIDLAPDGAGHQRLVLNGEPLFQYGTLDQGWWPDGLYAAPTDEALAFDVQKTKEMGFNLIRKHVKVEPARWYYHCDREGILVWQDMPSGDNEGEDAHGQFAQELEGVVRLLGNHPSIVMWVPFNEGWGQHDTEEIVTWLEETDPTRLVNNASGWTDTGVGDVLDIHRYPGPGAPTTESVSPLRPRAAVLGEFGGLGLPLTGHTWVAEDNWGYRSFETPGALNHAYIDLLTQLHPLIGEGLAAAVYTQTTDVEVEVNGVMTYDRKVVKLGPEARQANRTLFEPPPSLLPLVPTSREAGQSWRYTTSDPGEGWQVPEFPDTGWAEGMAGFGTEGTPGAVVRTVWDTDGIWIRRAFDLDATAVDHLREARLFLRIHHDEDAQVYLNGEPVADLGGYTRGYRLVELDSAQLAHLRAGSNTLAIHVRQTGGGQYIDAGIVEWVAARDR
ncbi:MAG: glycoside hydrolase family 2 TIM barrel-domain containing protein [Gemmatimonadota bacterium]